MYWDETRILDDNCILKCFFIKIYIEIIYIFKKILFLILIYQNDLKT